ncbi:hypothetical protein Tco_1007732 [Tanacetum coccineum]
MAALVRGGQICGDKKNGGSGGVGASSSAGPKSSGCSGPGMYTDPGKIYRKSDEGYFLGYSTSSKAFRVYNKRTKRVEENLHINFLKDQPNAARTGPNLMFDLEFLTNSMNYIPVSIENQDTQEKPFENASSDKDVQDSVDVADKEEQHQMQENGKDLQDELEMMITQELAAKAMDDVSRQGFEEEKRRIASQKKATQATSTNQLSTDRPFVSTDRSFVSTDRTLANGTQQLIASIDSKEYTITEASVRSKLQLADATGIHNLSDAEIYVGLATLGGYAGDFVPLLPAMLIGAVVDPGEGSAQPVEPHHTPVVRINVFLT